MIANGLVYYTIVFSSAGRPSIAFLSLMTFVMGMGMWFADVMADSLVAEKARLEPLASRGTLQSNCCKLSSPTLRPLIITNNIKLLTQTTW